MAGQQDNWSWDVHLARRSQIRGRVAEQQHARQGQVHLAGRQEFRGSVRGRQEAGQRGLHLGKDLLDFGCFLILGSDLGFMF
jgi:hypothetical protein